MRNLTPVSARTVGDADASRIDRVAAGCGRKRRTWLRPLALLLGGVAAMPSPAARALEPVILASFGSPFGTHPQTRLLRASDGNFYGTATNGGPNDTGTIFKMTPAGKATILVGFGPGTPPKPGALVESGGDFFGTLSYPVGGTGSVFRMTPAGALTTLVTFNGGNGAGPGDLVVGADGNLYGTTASGGGPPASAHGTVFRMTPAGVLTTLVVFNGSNGHTPTCGLIQGSDGNFYGTTSYGGATGLGTVFRMTPAGSLTTLATLDSGASVPLAGVVQGGDGSLYGTTYYGGGGGPPGFGAVFKVTLAGALTRLVSFTFDNGAAPRAALVRGSDGNFYGTTSSGGTKGNGTVFRMTPDGTLTTLSLFTGKSKGARPYAPLIEGGDGNFYGTTSGEEGAQGCPPTPYCGTIFKLSPSGALTTLLPRSFDDINPAAALVQAADGNLYGTTAGTAFRVTPAGAVTKVAKFVKKTTGTNPAASLLQAGDGNLYGTAVYGGAHGDGTAFRMTPAGVLTALASFSFSETGRYPYGGLALGGDGNFYGTNAGDGNGGAGIHDFGDLYRMTPAGAVTSLLTFTGSNGRYPFAGLIRGSDGNLYGTTVSGGTNDRGTIFRMTPAGALTTLVSMPNDDFSLWYPLGRLLEAGDGAFYGTAASSVGGSSGAVFRVTPAGALTKLVTFSGSNGAQPRAGLVRCSDGNFYGTTRIGGSTFSSSSIGFGTVFRMTPAGALTTIANFNRANGGFPLAGVIQASDGDVYGTTSIGGQLTQGTVYSLPGPPAIPAGVAATPGAGKVKLTWAAAPRAASYVIYMGTSPGGESGTPVATGITGTSRSITGLTPGTRYYFTVAAVNATSTTQPASEVSATPL